MAYLKTPGLNSCESDPSQHREVTLVATESMLQQASGDMDLLRTKTREECEARHGNESHTHVLGCCEQLRSLETDDYNVLWHGNPWSHTCKEIFRHFRNGSIKFTILVSPRTAKLQPTEWHVLAIHKHNGLLWEHT